MMMLIMMTCAVIKGGDAGRRLVLSSRLWLWLSVFNMRCMRRLRRSRRWVVFEQAAAVVVVVGGGGALEVVLSERVQTRL